MLSRRTVLIGAWAAAGAALCRRATPLLAKASQPATPISFAVPSGACDCHTHVFGNPVRFPFAAARAYTPEPATVEELRALHRALHLDRVVIVQPSVYGTDNACTLDAITQLGSRARGVAVIDEHTSDAALDEMDRAGIKGVRLNLVTGASGPTDIGAARQRFQSVAGRVARRNWHIQIYTQLTVIAALEEVVAASAVPVVFDHFGGAQAALGVSQTGFRSLLNLVHSGHAYVKISAPYRSSSRTPDYADVSALARALIDANPERMLWGSDWPHPGQTPEGRAVTDIAPFWTIDDGRILNQLAAWAPEASTRATILVENPKRLYHF